MFLIVLAHVEMRTVESLTDFNPSLTPTHTQTILDDKMTHLQNTPPLGE
jgi:hypothetical protein